MLLRDPEIPPENWDHLRPMLEFLLNSANESINLQFPVREGVGSPCRSANTRG
jgi:hypothetical protein